MESNGTGGGRRRANREASPDRFRDANLAPRKLKGLGSDAAAARKVQVVYYLSRNGQLDHPHFMEISHLPHQRLRLKDVLDRLTVLRGRGMPSLFSWSCKRSYKNGYVWNDLSDNDVIYPADGAEYVLKGSEVIHGCTPQSLERFPHLQLVNDHPRHLPTINMEAEEEDEQEHEASGNLTVVKPHRIPGSRAVTTVETEHHHQKGNYINDTTAHRSGPTEIIDDSSPPSSSSSDKTSAAPGGIRTGCASFLFEGSEPPPEQGHTRNSVLLQLISCGSIAVKGGRPATGRSLSSFLKPSTSPPVDITASGRKSGVSCAAAELMCMPDNPRRVGNPQIEDKQYFSGSIVEAIAVSDRVAAEPALKKSSSYNEERGAKLGMEEGEGDDNGGRARGMCIPGRKRSSAKQ